jgi:NAD(P)-dependent dehydrogenase (short-subunit alcohol dehydrogenase family)
MRKSGEIQELEKAHPLGLGGTPDDVASAAVYLASEQAHWNTGFCLPVDGGVSATI